MEEPVTSKTKGELSHSVDEKFYDSIQFLESTSATVTTVVEEIKTMEKKREFMNLVDARTNDNTHFLDSIGIGVNQN
ncbi:hypothetical protein P3S68_020330 [Capsicum galapagoense]